MSNLYRGPSIDASYQVSYHLAKRFQRKSCFWNQTIRNKNCLWQPCLLTNQNGCFLPSFGLFGQAVLEKKIFRNWPIRKKNCLWWPCLLTDWDKMSNLYKRTFHRCFLPSFGSFGHAVSEEKIFRNRPIRNKNRMWWPCLLMDMGENEQSIEDLP
jgi:Zn-finger protein